MSRSPPALPLDPALRQALTSLVAAQAPRNRVLTLAAVEQAVFDLLKPVRTQVTQEVIVEQGAVSETRGTGRRVVGTRCAGPGNGLGRC